MGLVEDLKNGNCVNLYEGGDLERKEDFLIERVCAEVVSDEHREGKKDVTVYLEKEDCDGIHFIEEFYRLPFVENSGVLESILKACVGK